MPRVKCGFADSPDKKFTGSLLLGVSGPWLAVDIGFDPTYKPTAPAKIPAPGISGVIALIDTGASECCIDSELADKLKLPIIDRRRVAGIGGLKEVNMYLAQISVPSLAFTIYGAFAGVDLAAGGQQHRALMGRSFLRAFTMVYSGPTGDFELSR